MPSIETDAQWVKVLFPVIKEAYDKQIEKLDRELAEEGECDDGNISTTRA